MLLPTGTITFLFTDIESSTRLWEQRPDAMRVALARHDALLRQAIETHRGVVFKTMGDAFCAAFAAARDAVAAALAAQRALSAETWPAGLALRVRIALHAGDAEQRDSDYFGPPLNRVARLLAIGHGGQTLLSQAARNLTDSQLPPGAALRDLGEHRLRDLTRPEHVFQVHCPPLPADFPPLRSLSSPELPNNLPAQLTSFIGRQREMADIHALIGRTRLLTLVGPGGSGKTRLLLQAAADLLDRYPDGIWFADLAPLSDPSLVPQAVAAILNARAQAGQSLLDALTEFLQPRRLLLLLDNCEHLIAACARLADTILRACPQVTLFATSREPLRIAAEQTYRVPPLSLPDLRRTPDGEPLLQSESVLLFLERARQHRPDFALTPADAPAIAQMCRRLDGIPLALELAASRVRALPVREINRRLDDRFRLLTGGSRVAVPRQQTLRALIDWSYALLDAAERALLDRLAVFAGGWTLEAAEAVCADSGPGPGVLPLRGGAGYRGSGAPPDVGASTGLSVGEQPFPASVPGTPTPAAEPLPAPEEVLDLLTSLVDKSLLLFEETEGTARYRILETVRQYALERLRERQEEPTLRRRHAEFFLAQAETAEPHLLGAEQTRWLDRLECDLDNFRAALDLLLTAEGCEPQAVRLAGAFFRYWYVRGDLREGQAVIQRALPLAERLPPDAYLPERARAEHVAGLLYTTTGDYAQARQHFLRCLELRRAQDDHKAAAGLLNNLGYVAHEQADYAAAQRFLEEARALFRQLGDDWGLATVLNNLGRIPADQGEAAPARACYAESLAITRRLDDRHGIAMTLMNLGQVERRAGDLDRARDYLEESLAIRKEIGDRLGLGLTLSSLGMVAVRQQRGAEAADCLREALSILREVNDRPALITPLECAVALLIGLARALEAVTLLGAVAALRDRFRMPGSAREQADLAEWLEAARAGMDADTFAAARDTGRQMTLEQAVEYALQAAE